MKWTDTQLQAINIPVSDIIVSAAAGSGKTAVMAERIISRLTGENYIDIDKILVVTYTNAAASEIKERVMKKLIEKIRDGNNKDLERQLVLLGNSHFCTIHSFCLELIKKYFYILNIDPSVKTGDQTELNTLLNKAVDTVFTQYFEIGDTDFYNLLTCYGNNREAVLTELIINIYNFSRTMPDSIIWLDSLASKYSKDNKEALSYIMESTVLSLQYAITECEKAIEIITQNSCFTEYLPNIECEKNLLVKAISSDSYSKMYDAIYSINFERLPAVKKSDNSHLKSEIKSYRDNVKKIITSIKEKLICVPYDEIINDNNNIYPTISKLVEVVKKVSLEYDNLKREKNLIDFSDYEHMALKLLKNPDGTPSDIAYSVSESFNEIYIDEYQDCNNIQDTIFKYISGSIRNKPNIFCVGDMKQSIYKFRDANPLNFRYKCDTSPQYNGNDVNYQNKILLNSNFRSRKSILDYVNSVFSQLMSVKCGQLEYTDDEALKYGGGYIDINPDINKIDIDIINESNDFGDDDFIALSPKVSKQDAEVLHIASKIKSYIENGYMLYDKKNNIKRNARFSDIVILLRSPASFASSFEKIFSMLKIPLYCDINDAYFESEEIEFLISFLKIIDNPDDDIALTCVMKNPIFGFDENKLLTIRLGGCKGSFYKCINEYIKKHNDDIKLKLQKFIQRLDDYHIKSKYMETGEFLSYLLDDINFYVYLSAFADAKTKKVNVRYLLHKAKQFETNSFKGIFSFVKYIENIKEASSGEAAKLTSENDNVVRLMSIHKSKGLEFPIVFLAGTGKKYNMTDLTGRVVIHKDLGVGVDCVYSDRGYKLNSINKLAIKQKIKFEDMSEELRVLYVALTRPTEKLVITGTVKNGASFLNTIEQKLKSQKHKLSPFLVSNSKNFLETILLASFRSENFETASYKKDYLCVKDGVDYNITLKNISRISHYNSISKSKSYKDEFVSVTDDYEKISHILSYKYPYENYVSIPGNLTVTEIKKMSDEDNNMYLYDDINLKKPSNFSHEKKIHANELGTLIHTCMENFNLTHISSEEDVNNQLNKLINSGIISEDETKEIDIKKIINFGSSALCKRIVSCKNKIYKEFSFKYMLDACEIYDVKKGEKLIVQGTIDLFFEDDDGKLVIVDYKTDMVKNNDALATANRYKVQLDCYAKALSHIFKKEVKEKIIYLFDKDEFVIL